jgi:hypothetical protein
MTEAAQQQPATPSAPPANATEARARLDTLIADKDFGAKLVKGEAGANREFRDLSELAAKGEAERVDVAMAGVMADTPFQDSGHLQNIAATKMFRELGIRDEVIRETLTDRPVTQQEHDVVAKWKADRMRDSEYVKKWLSGEGEQAREMMLANIVLSSSIKKEASA